MPTNYSIIISLCNRSLDFHSKASCRVSDASLEHAVRFAPEVMGDLDNHLSAGEGTANGQAMAEERMDYFEGFQNETMIAEEVGANNYVPDTF